jgi:hypothetical protein
MPLAAMSLATSSSSSTIFREKQVSPEWPPVHKRDSGYMLAHARWNKCATTPIIENCEPNFRFGSKAASQAFIIP